jgi:hypothetical protein
MLTTSRLSHSLVVRLAGSEPPRRKRSEFLPIAIPHYKFFGGSFYYPYGQSVGHKSPAKRFICGYCVVKIPDWKTCFSIYIAAKLRQS